MSPQFDSGQGEIQQRITAAWSEVLGVAEVSVDANFFDIGGTSLKALQVYSKVRDVLGQVSVTDLFRYPTIRSLVEQVVGAGAMTEAPAEIEAPESVAGPRSNLTMSSDERAERQRQAFDQLRNRS